MYYSKHLLLSSLMATSLFVLQGCGSSGSTKPPSPAPAPIDYQREIDSIVSAEIPGIVLLVETPEERFLGNAGSSDIDTIESIQYFHQIPTASTSKQMITLLVALLYEEGILDIDNTIATWLPEEMIAQIPHGDQITLRQLINHTSGIFNHLEESNFFEAVIDDT